MLIKIASWNIEGRLSNISLKRRGKPEHIFESIKKLDADIVILIEAHAEISIKQSDYRQRFIDIGYRVFDVPYEDDTGSRPDSHFKRLSMILLSRMPVKNFKIIRLADFRNALTATVSFGNNDQTIRIFGIHLDDRLESTRIKQISDLLQIINKNRFIPTILMGDFNATHMYDFRSRFLRSKFANLLTNCILPKITKKVIGMATGKTLQLLESQTKLSDADSRHKPTETPKMLGREWLPSIPLVQIDHMYVSEKIEIKGFNISRDGGSDHRAISAMVELIG